MPFVHAKCPECGGMLNIDGSKKAGVCQFCGEPFIVEEAVNNYNTYNTTNNNFNTDNRTTNNYGSGSVVHVYENKESVSALLERAFMFLEEGNFIRADEYCERVLDIEPENGQAYLGKLMVDLRIRNQSDLKYCDDNFLHNSNYQKIIRFGDEALKKFLGDCLNAINERRLEGLYNQAKTKMHRAGTEEAYKQAAKDFNSLGTYKDSFALAKECLKKAENARQEALKKAEIARREFREKAERARQDNLEKEKLRIEKENQEKDIILQKGMEVCGDFSSVNNLKSAIEYFKSIPGWKDADIWLAKSEEKLNEFRLAEQVKMDEIRSKANKQAKKSEKKKTKQGKRNEAEIKAESIVPIIWGIVVVAFAIFVIIACFSAGDIWGGICSLIVVLPLSFLAFVVGKYLFSFIVDLIIKIVCR